MTSEKSSAHTYDLLACNLPHSDDKADTSIVYRSPLYTAVGYRPLQRVAVVEATK